MKTFEVFRATSTCAKHGRFAERECLSGTAREKATCEVSVEDMNREIADFEAEGMAKAGQESGISIGNHGENDGGHGVESGGPLLVIIELEN